MTSEQEFELKVAIRTRDGYRCLLCGMTEVNHQIAYGRALHVHRIVPGSEYAMEGCETLCEECHAVRHRELRGKSRGEKVLVAFWLGKDDLVTLKKLAGLMGGGRSRTVALRRLLAAVSPPRELRNRSASASVKVRNSKTGLHVYGSRDSWECDD
jgi:hypothetical protein